MATPHLTRINTAINGWDAAYDDNLKVLGIDGDPTPVSAFASVGALPDPVAFANCIAVVLVSARKRIVISDGTAWILQPEPAAALADTVAADLAALKVDHNLLLARLRTSGALST